MDIDRETIKRKNGKTCVPFGHVPDSSVRPSNLTACDNYPNMRKLLEIASA